MTALLILSGLTIIALGVKLMFTISDLKAAVATNKTLAEQLIAKANADPSADIDAAVQALNAVNKSMSDALNVPPAPVQT